MTDSMKYQISPIPEPPKEIIDAVNDDKLVVFIGAGVSRIIGCMGWDQLARNLVNKCFETKKNDGSPCINFKEKETLSQISDHKKTITICHHILKKNGFENIFHEELKKSLEGDEKLLKNQNIYNELWGLRGLFITTNADKHFDDSKFTPQSIIYKEEDFTPSNIDRTKLYHIHGSISDKESIIFTAPQYIKRYRREQFRSFLEEIFGKYVVLFVGYGMGEFELLDFLMTKADPKRGKELRHFILLPFYKGEENILGFEQAYYNSLGVSVLAYQKDERGYGQLYEVIKNWNSEINQTSAYLNDTLHEIEDAVNNYDKSKEDRIFQIIKNDKPQEDFFFKTLAKSSNPFPWLKPLKEKDYFLPERNPPPQEAPGKEGYFTVPYWNILDYLENVVIQNAKNPSDDITNLLIEIINSILKYQNETKNRVANYRTDWYIVKIIFNFPIEKITDDHIKFIGWSLRSKLNVTLIVSEISKTVFPKLINNKAKEHILKLLDVIFAYQKSDKEATEKYTSIMKEYWLDETLKKHKKAIAELCGIEAGEIVLSKIFAITKEDKSRFNIIYIPTIEDHPQSSITRYKNYQCQLVYFVRDMFELSASDKVKNKVKALMIEEHPIFKRIAIHTVNSHYNDLKELFWKWDGNPLEEIQLKHELYEFFKINCISFNKSQIKKVLTWIESKKYNIGDNLQESEKKKVVAYRKKEWLSALLETNNKDVLSYYNKYDKINPAKLDHPGFDFWTESWMGTISPIEKIELLEKSNEEIAKYINDYTEGEGFKKPSKEGLSETLKKSVSENPQKFAVDMKPFLSIQSLYQHALLWGLDEAWNAKKEFTWEGVLDFLSGIVETDNFWDDKYEKDNKGHRNWIISQIAQLIENGTKDDNHAFDANLLSKAEKILLILAERTESDLFMMNDLVTSVLNSTKGKVFSAMVNYSLRYARLYKKNQEERWNEKIKKDFEERLNNLSKASIEFSLTLGKFLANLQYLDKKWLINNINRIFPKNNETYWEAAFTGYLFYSNKVYKDLYSMLKENGHYNKGIKTEFSDPYIMEHLVQHICLGYLEEMEKLDDSSSLISFLLNNQNVKQLSEIVRFFWALREQFPEKYKTKIKPIWKSMVELLLHNEEKPEFQKIFSELTKWLSLIDKIDEESLEWVKLSAKYIEYHETYEFINGLLRHSKENSKNVGEIFLEMLNAGVYPDYRIEDIQNIVRVLYENGQNEHANRICNLYGAKGFEFLKAIYEENIGSGKNKPKI